MTVALLQLGTTEYALFGVVLLGCLSGTAGLAYWAVTDARNRGRPSPWFDGLLAVGFSPYILLYLYWRGERTSPPTRRELVARDWAGVVIGTFVIGAVFSPPDPLTQVLWATPMMLVGGLLVGYRHRGGTGSGNDVTA
jgi:sec-independent protein translocase protein TatC